MYIDSNEIYVFCIRNMLHNFFKFNFVYVMLVIHVSEKRP